MIVSGLRCRASVDRCTKRCWRRPARRQLDEHRATWGDSAPRPWQGDCRIRGRRDARACRARASMGGMLMLLVLACVFAGQCEVAPQGDRLAVAGPLDLGAAEPGLRALGGDLADDCGVKRGGGRGDVVLPGSDAIGLRVSNVSGGCRLSRENGAIQPCPPLHYFCESL